jgi:hypothetical protein
MSITQHQFEQLTEMGISLWQKRTCDTSNNTEDTQTHTYLDIDLSVLAQQQVFTDILLAIGLTIGEISQQGNHLDLVLFNWYFTDDQQENKIHWINQQLFTPSIANIAKSPKLKKQLWQLLDQKTQ